MLISQEMYIFLTVSSILGLLFGVIGTIIGSSALIRTIAAEKSTHNVTYMPIDEEIDKANNEFVNKWATDQTTLVKQQELFKEDLEEQMPDFFPDEEESKITSF